MHLEIRSLFRNKWMYASLVAIAILVFALSDNENHEQELIDFGVYVPALVKEVIREKGGKFGDIYYAKAWYEVSGHRYFLKTRLRVSNAGALFYPNSLRTPKHGDTLLLIYSSRNPWISRLEKVLPEK